MAVVEVPVRRDAADMQMASDAFFFGRQHQGAAGACVCFITNDKGRRVAGRSSSQCTRAAATLAYSDPWPTHHVPGHCSDKRQAIAEPEATGSHGTWQCHAAALHAC
jgi:hypothetical protein